MDAAASDALPVTLVNELKRIGNNLNQIAHNANCGIPPADGALAKTMAEVFRVLAENAITSRRLQEAFGAVNMTPVDTDARLRADQVGPPHLSKRRRH